LELVDTMTEKNAGLVEGLVLKPATNGRRTYSKAAKRALVELCKQPGASVAGLALAHGINANLLRRWMNQYGGDGSPPRKQQRAALLPVTTSYPIESVVPPVHDIGIEIAFRGSTIRIRGSVDAQALTTVLDCLARRP
jgi:transposase